MSKNFYAAFNSDSESEAPAAAKPVATKKPTAAAATKKPAVGAPAAAAKPRAVTTKEKSLEDSKAMAAVARKHRAEAEKVGSLKREEEKRPVQSSRGRGGRGGYAGRGREFDRRSGTGRGKEAKRGGAGANNWGAPGDELKTMVEEEEKPAVEGEESPADVVVAEGEAEQEVAEEKEPEKEVFTLEQFLAKKAEKRTGLGFEEKGSVKVEEIKEGKQYSKKGNDAEDEVFMKFGAEKSRKEKKEKKSKQVVPTGFVVRDDSVQPEYRERGGRGGRGRGGGRGGARGGGRGGRERNANSSRNNAPSAGGAPLASSESNFPSLGAQ